MAGISTRVRGDGSKAFQVRWRPGGVRSLPQVYETFSSLTRAENFRQLVEEAGERWPEGWVKGKGFVTAEEHAGQPSLAELGARYVDQLTGIQPDTRSRYRRQVKVLAAVLPQPSADMITDEDVKRWVNTWDRSPKTIANHHGLLYSVFEFGVAKKIVRTNPCSDTKLPRKDVDISVDEKVFLDEGQYALLALCCIDDVTRDLVAVAVGTGLRFGELTALWAGDVDLGRRTLTVRRAWKKEGDGGERPQAVKTSQKHEINRGHYLGPPKTKKARRTISLSDSVLEVLERRMRGKAKDDLIFTTEPRSTVTGLGGRVTAVQSATLRWGGGRALNQIDFYESRWAPTLKAAAAAGLTVRPRFHDLRHTHAAWLISAGVPLPVIQQRLGHESITTTIDTYGGLLPQAHEVADDAIEAAMAGGKIAAKRRLKVAKEPS